MVAPYTSATNRNQVEEMELDKLDRISVGASMLPALPPQDPPVGDVLTYLLSSFPGIKPLWAGALCNIPLCQRLTFFCMGAALEAAQEDGSRQTASAGAVFLMFSFAHCLAKQCLASALL